MTQTAPAGTSYPGKTLGIVGLVLAFFFSVIGLILSAVALSQSKKAGYKNTPAKVGLILGIIFTAISVIWTIIVIAGAVAAASAGYVTVG
ncbi:hypothetical protein [Microbacterium sp. GXF7504]